MDVTPLDDVQPRPRRVAVGEFDGVHRGHRRVIADNDTVLTFEPHPAVVVHPERAPKLLTTLELKAELIAGLGVRELVVIPFDRGFAHQSPEEFIDHILVERLGATHVSVGENFRFGHQASGTTALLGSDRRFSTHVETLLGADGETISSTRIRILVAQGDVAGAAALLGSPFRARGTVIDGDKRGRDLGYPTANVAPDSSLVCPGYGIYAGRVSVPGRPGPGRDGTWGAAVSVGVRPTFGDGLHPLIEPYLLDFSGDLYGETITVEFVDRLRGEVRFGDLDGLLAQMADDVAATRDRLT